MKSLLFITWFALLSIFTSTTVIADNRTSNVISVDDIKWGYLNPLRGKLSPEAANLWGDRTKNIPTGMLVKFNKGFQSPPHIHNISYRAIVIDGLLHNDDPNAAKMWLPNSSFWTQPAGGNHITAANGATNLIYLEIDSGPYLVKPTKQAFNTAEHPLNLHKNNLVWLDNTVLNNIKTKAVKTTFLWKKARNSGTMIKLPKHFRGEISTNASEFSAVLISGKIRYHSQEQNMVELNKGSFITSVAPFTHYVENMSNDEAILYIRTNGQYSVK